MNDRIRRLEDAELAPGLFSSLINSIAVTRVAIYPNRI